MRSRTMSRCVLENLSCQSPPLVDAGFIELAADAELAPAATDDEAEPLSYLGLKTSTYRMSKAWKVIGFIDQITLGKQLEIGVIKDTKSEFFKEIVRFIIPA